MNQSPLDAVIFDLDGTLVDSNQLQINAWQAAFHDFSYKVGQDRVEREIGKGGDQLVADLLGEEVEKKDGEDLRHAQAEHAAQLIRRDGVKAFDGACDLLEQIRKRDLQVVLATSSSQKITAELIHSAELLPAKFDLVVCGDDVKSTKPRGDIYHLTLKKLQVSPAECVNIGDTPYDCIAGRKAGLVTLGLSGELNNDATLRRAGARATVKDIRALIEQLDDMLKLAAPRSVRLTGAEMERLMNLALTAAEYGMSDGEVPIGAVLADEDGAVISTGCNRMNKTQNKIAHAEIVAFQAAAGKVDVQARGLTLVSTLEPCVMCLGAAMEAGIDTVVYGLPAPADGGSARVTPPTSPESQMPRIIGHVLSERSKALFEQWLVANPDSPQTPFVRQLIASVQS